jgi:hypothetical protein
VEIEKERLKKFYSASPAPRLIIFLAILQRILPVKD